MINQLIFLVIFGFISNFLFVYIYIQINNTKIEWTHYFLFAHVYLSLSFLRGCETISFYLTLCVYVIIWSSDSMLHSLIYFLKSLNRNIMVLAKKNTTQNWTRNVSSSTFSNNLAIFVVFESSEQTKGKIAKDVMNLFAEMLRNGF